MSLGPTEFMFIAIIALLLFGPTLLAFWLGFVLGRKRGVADEESQRPAPGAPADTTSKETTDE